MICFKPEQNGVEEHPSFPLERHNGVRGNEIGQAAGAARLGGLLREAESESVRKVECCVAYMVGHLNQPLQVATLAALVNVSPSHFFALFKRRMGCPPMDYFTRLRMRRACRLLDLTSASVKEVAAALGYDDPFYFSRVFKSVNGASPREYRSRTVELKNQPKRAVLEAFPLLNPQ